MANITTTVYIKRLGGAYHFKKIWGYDNLSSVIEETNEKLRRWDEILPKTENTVVVYAQFYFPGLGSFDIRRLFQLIKDAREHTHTIFYIGDLKKDRFEVDFEVPKSFFPTSEDRIIQLLIKYVEEALEAYNEMKEENGSN